AGTHASDSRPACSCGSRPFRGQSRDCPRTLLARRFQADTSTRDRRLRGLRAGPPTAGHACGRARLRLLRARRRVRLARALRADLLRSGPGAALYAIVDRIVDDYQPVVAALDREIEDVEREVFSPDPRNTAEQIYDLKREVLALHAAVAPLAEPLDRLARGRLRFIDDDIHAYFRDAHDHLLRILGQVESCRDLLTSVLAANMTQVTVRQNEDVRKISSWAAIVAVPTLITSIYGMNFRHMPELTWRFGYPLAIAGILAVCAALYAYFRRIGWL